MWGFGGFGFGRGRGKGFCQYIWQYYLEKGEFPEIEINGEKIKLMPGMGIGRLIMLKYLEKLVESKNKKE